MTFDGVILAGGRGRRLGGVSKPEVTVGGRRLLDIALDALVGARSTVVVGPRTSTARRVTWTREDPPGAGPVAALQAALAVVDAPIVVVLAADLPFISVEAVAALRFAIGDAPGVVAVDESGREQPLIGCYDTARLRAAMPSTVDGAAMRAVLNRLDVDGRLQRLALSNHPPVAFDCDTADDLHRAEELA